MLTDWGLLVSIGGVLVLGVGILLTNSVRYFTIREYDAYLKSQEIAMQALDRRLEDQLDRIKVLEQCMIKMIRSSRQALAYVYYENGQDAEPQLIC